MGFQEQLQKEQDNLRLQRARVRTEWRKACRWDKLDPDKVGPVVEFSEDNPFVVKYENEVRRYANLLRPTNV